ncbi:MAG TPA: M20/M25/M40 family metallo-hydrolase, partial [Candidatus Acidoferrales bacterium]|nr:M20/M25/M40 family metallo-hydrolase [Candidatus Acidoferrales bacterium]
MTNAIAVKSRLSETVSCYEEEMAGFLEELVAIPTENPPGRNYPKCVGRLEEKCRELGLATEVAEVPAEMLEGAEPRACILATHGTGKRVLYMHGHYDVVPAQSREQFQPRRKGRHAFGRGTADMKGGLVAKLYAVKALRECGIALEGRIALVFVPDEETGGKFGSEFLAARGLLGKDAIGMVTGEPTGGVIWNANRGAISLRVRIHGKSAHVGLQQAGVNAFEQMLRAAEELRKLKSRVERRKTRYRVMPERARNSILMMGGEFAGGSNFNVVPEECSFTVDRRINPEEDLAAEREELLRVFEKLKRKGIRLETEIFQEGESGGTDEEEDLGRALAQ